MPGQTLYIMGSSGAGKTSLLNLLADRVNRKNPGFNITGEIMLNKNTPVSDKSFGIVGSYVMQDDILFEDLTVKEAITFSARLKLNVSERE